MAANRDEAMRQRTGMARWWQADDLGYYYCVQCDCGGVVEAVYRDDAVAGAGIRAESRCLERFRAQYPDCPHIAKYEAISRDPERSLAIAGEIITDIEESWNLLWGY